MIKLNEIEQFQLFCLENYKSAKEIAGKTAFLEFNRFGVFDYLSNGYEVLHTQSRNYIIAEIIDFIDKRK